MGKKKIRQTTELSQRARHPFPRTAQPSLETSLGRHRQALIYINRPACTAPGIIYLRQQQKQSSGKKYAK